MKLKFGWVNYAKLAVLYNNPLSMNSKFHHYSYTSVYERIHFLPNKYPNCFYLFSIIILQFHPNLQSILHDLEHALIYFMRRYHLYVYAWSFGHTCNEHVMGPRLYIYAFIFVTVSFPVIVEYYMTLQTGWYLNVRNEALLVELLSMHF